MTIDDSRSSPSSVDSPEPGTLAASPTRSSTVAYQGEPGAFSEAAAHAYFGAAAVPLARHTFEDVARAVAEGDAAVGMLPVENTLAGAVAPAWDAIAAAELVVIGEVVWPIRLCLLGVRGASSDGVRRALSHPVALAQCGRFFRAHPGIEPVPVHDTAGAARQVAELGDASAAAIAARHAAEVYGLDVLEDHIQDRPDNQTRFFVVARSARAEPTTDLASPRRSGRAISGARKTALLIETPNRPGALLAVLQPIAEHGINLTHLASRPGDEPWTYRFFIEIDAGAEDPRALAALDAVRARSTSFRVMGSFPAAAPRT